MRCTNTGNDLSDASTTPIVRASKSASVGRTEQEMHIKASPESQCDDLLGSSRRQILWRLQIGYFCNNKKLTQEQSVLIFILVVGKDQRCGAARYHGMTLFTSADKLVKCKIQRIWIRLECRREQAAVMSNQTTSIT